MPKLEITVPDLPIPSVSLSMDKDYSVRIGRSEAAEICLPIASVSSMHCTISRAPGGYELRDAGSTNGIIFQNQRVAFALLTPGEEAWLGEAGVKLVASDEESSIFEEEAPHLSRPASSMPTLPEEEPMGQPTPQWSQPPVQPASDDSFVDLSALNLDGDQVVPERENLISSTPLPESVKGIDLPSVNSIHPEYGQLHYGAIQAEDSPHVSPQAAALAARFAQTPRKNNYPAMVLYALIMFVLGVGVGVTYKYYTNTGELLPMVMMGIHSPKATLSQHKQQAQDELNRAKAEREADAKDNQ